MSSKQTENFYEEESKDYDDKRWSTPAGKFINTAQMEILDNLLEGGENIKILEIAAGTGRFTQHLLQKGNSITALDISKGMLEQLEKRLRENSDYNKLNIYVGDAKNFGLCSSSFDVVVCFNALSHISEYGYVFGEVYRILKSGGIFLFNVPNYISPYFPIGLYVNYKEKSVFRDVYTRWYNLKEVEETLNKLGFRIDDIKGQFHFPSTTPSFLLPLLKTIDKNLRTGTMSKFAPVLFIKAHKYKSQYQRKG